MIMNTKKQQSKQVTGVVQDAPPKDYIGLETDTAIVHIDADTKEISVDVLTHNLVDWSGEDANKGYPAPLGHDALVRADMALLGIRDEQNRAEEAEQRLEYLIEKTEEQISIGDGKVLLKVLAEAERAEAAEQSLQSNIDFAKVELSNTINDTKSELVETINKTDEALSKDIYDTNVKLSNTKTDLQNQINNTNKNVESAVTSIEATIQKTSKELKETIDDLDVELSNSIDDVSKELNQTKTNLTSEITTTKELLLDTIEETDNHINEVKSRVENIEYNYASKVYVHEQIVQSIQLSKQVIDAIDLENNVVIINGENTVPLDGTLYMLKDETNKGADIYKEYTTIDGKLTLIGDTSMSLEGYATETYVNQQIDAIPEVDLTPYAKKTDIPDVSSFIAEIPEEYVTDSELTAKGYYTQEDVTTLLTGIKFIDGGNAASMLK